MQRTYQLDQLSDRFLFKTTLNFDPSVLGIFLATDGGSASDRRQASKHQSNPALLVETILRHEATVRLPRPFVADPLSG